MVFSKWVGPVAAARKRALKRKKYSWPAVATQRRPTHTCTSLPASAKSARGTTESIKFSTDPGERPSALSDTFSHHGNLNVFLTSSNFTFIIKTLSPE